MLCHHENNSERVHKTKVLPAKQCTMLILYQNISILEIRKCRYKRLVFRKFQRMYEISNRIIFEIYTKRGVSTLFLSGI